MSFLMKSQRAELHHILTTNGFSPGDFEIVGSTEPQTGTEGEAVRMKGMDHYFAVYPNLHSDSYFPDKFLIEFSPGHDESHEAETCKEWRYVLLAFVRYLSYLQREVTTEDPWEEIARFTGALGSLESTSESDSPL